MNKRITLTLGLFMASAAAATAAVTVDSVAGAYDGNQATIASTVSLDMNADFGFTFWFQTTTFEDRDLLSFGDSADYFRVRLDEMSTADNWAPELEGSTGGGRIQEGDFSDPGNTADGSWHQLSYIFDYDEGLDDGTGLGSLYLDGSFLGSAGEVNNFPEVTGTASIFAGNKAPFDGSISDIAWYDSNTPLTAALIGDFYNAGAGTIAIPEPASSVALLGLGALLIGFLRRRKAS